MCNAFFHSMALRRLIRSHFSVTGAAESCPTSLFCLRHPLQLSPHHRLPCLPVCMVPSLLYSLLTVPPRPTERSPEAHRGHVRRRDQGTGDTAGTTCKSRFIRNFSHPCRQGTDFPCAVMRKRWRLQGCLQSIHKGSKSYPGNHGHRRFQGGKRSRKTRYAMEGVY